MSTSESWGVYGHNTVLPPYLWSCGFGWCPAEGYEAEISTTPWALRLGKGLYYYYYYLLCLHISLKCGENDDESVDCDAQLLVGRSTSREVAAVDKTTQAP